MALRPEAGLRKDVARKAHEDDRVSECRRRRRLGLTLMIQENPDAFLPAKRPKPFVRPAVQSLTVLSALPRPARAGYNFRLSRIRLRERGCLAVTQAVLIQVVLIQAVLIQGTSKARAQRRAPSVPERLPSEAAPTAPSAPAAFRVVRRHEGPRVAELNFH